MEDFPGQAPSEPQHGDCNATDGFSVCTSVPGHGPVHWDRRTQHEWSEGKPVDDAPAAPWAPLDAAEAFYVTIRRGRKNGCLLGPYSSREEALAQVDAGRELAVGQDPFAAFDLFGTARVEQVPGHETELPSGRLNKLWEERYGQVQPG